MRAVKSRDTTPERRVRALLRAFAPGYRLHRADLPGKPDIVYAGRRLAILVHGCFWHGHDCPRGARPPANNADYWRAKIARNRARDAAHGREARGHGLAGLRGVGMRAEGRAGAGGAAAGGARGREVAASARHWRAVQQRLVGPRANGAPWFLF